MVFHRWFCAAILAAAAPVFAIEPFVIKDIRVEGIQRTEAGTVFSYLPVKVGDTMSDEKAAQAIRALFGTGFYKDVSIEADGNVLVIAVQERSSIAQVEFTGIKEFDKDQLLKSLRQIGLSEGRIFDRSQLDRAEQELKRQYLSLGRYAVVVTTTITPLERNRVAVNFTVDEGGCRENPRDQHHRGEVFRGAGSDRPVRVAHTGVDDLVEQARSVFPSETGG